MMSSTPCLFDMNGTFVTVRRPQSLLRKHLPPLRRAKHSWQGVWPPLPSLVLRLMLQPLATHPLINHRLPTMAHRTWDSSLTLAQRYSRLPRRSSNQVDPVTRDPSRK